jgi:hypothetical protein
MKRQGGGSEVVGEAWGCRGGELERGDALDTSSGSRVEERCGRL